MFPVSTARCCAALLVSALLTACASQPAPAPAPDADNDSNWQSPLPAQDGDSQRQSPCAWTQVRGVAKLLSLTSARSAQQATWQFFPGDDILFHPAPAGSQVGDEFKALLRRPLNGQCETLELYLVAPL